MIRGPDRLEKLIVIPDAHAHPQYSNDRFDWLARFIASEKPDGVLALGDFADMPALSSYDKGKRGFEGRRYVRDVEATRDAMKRTMVGWDAPRWMCIGNHEARIDRATSDASEMEGVIGLEDLGYVEHGWQCAPFQSAVQIGGFMASHHFASGVGGRPIGGMTQAASMARLLFQSAIVGHSHTLDWARRTRPDGSRIVCIVPGCYADPEQATESWCAGTGHLWWHGVLVLEGVSGGDFESMRLVTMAALKARFSDAPTTTAKAPAKRPSARARLWKGAA